MATSSKLSEMRSFLVIWSGQLVSTIGSGLTGFALGVWIYQETRSTTLFPISLLAYALPNLLVAPFAGALVDRWDRRKAMIFSDSGAGLCTLIIAVLLITGRLELWNTYLLIAASAAFNTFQWPAYSAATSLLVPKEQLGRAGGMVQIGEAVWHLIAPAVAGVLMVTVGLQGVLLVDFVTFMFAVFTLLLVAIPRPPASQAAGAEKSSLLLKEETVVVQQVCRTGKFIEGLFEQPPGLFEAPGLYEHFGDAEVSLLAADIGRQGFVQLQCPRVFSEFGQLICKLVHE